MSIQKAFLLFLFPFFLHQPVQADGFAERNGIGVVHAAPYNHFHIDFFKNANDRQPHDKIFFERDSLSLQLKPGFATTEQDSVPAWFNPEIFYIGPEINRLDFFCLEKEGQWARIITNKKTGETKWVQLGPDIQFQNWHAFFQTVANVEIFANDPFLFTKPAEKSAKQKIASKMQAGERQQILPLKVEGKWMYVEVIRFDENHKEESRVKGWIKWRDNQNFLIGYNLIGC
ncbi:MAG TPA: hypothetical protein VI731_12050 [Bacteroidia bacterium]|nr:hypothetical protein [Bacteroidia bacterium]